ncbi:hypothetical protein J8J42_02475 [Chryseobacterium sp. cx-311]|uniref:hypothetical protein n=1 Tax=Marnyiella aurantia TaxID=2758037 RepID=UPI001AE1F719|nr:hypothetical protein [Marnyiella aurantia]MBP0611909.1 hypothetical protein [Marnyiella aurantia]
MKPSVLSNFGKKKESSGQSQKLQDAFQKMQKKAAVEPSREPAEPKIEQKKVEKVKPKNYNFSFSSEAENMNYIRALEFEKRRQDPEFFQFTASDVVKEGVELLRQTGQRLKKRPAGMIPTRRGRVMKGAELNNRVRTSFSLTENDVEFIYDYIYTKSGNVLGAFTKEDFMNDMIGALKAKYGEL